MERPDEDSIEQEEVEEFISERVGQRKRKKVEKAADYEHKRNQAAET